MNSSAVNNWEREDWQLMKKIVVKLDDRGEANSLTRKMGWRGGKMRPSDLAFAIIGTLH